MKLHHRIHMKDAFVWRYPEAPLDLARALGQIAADLWAAGKLTLIGGTFVATVGTTDGPNDDNQERGGEAEVGSS